MKVYYSLEEIKDIEETVVALGNFDGVHLGHQEIIHRTVESARTAGLKSAVFTFSNHTSTILPDMKPVKNILYEEDKLRIIEEMGVDYMIDIPFTKEILSMKAEDFISGILVEKLRIKEAYCGFNYTFGYKAEGTPKVLMEEGLRHGFGIHVQEPFMIDGKVVSSTWIRELISKGEMEECSKLMGRVYSIGGKVIEGNRLGRTIGFPTCNLVVDETMVTPPNGVYISMCILRGKKHRAVTNVGNKPTVGDYAKNIETHIFDFDEEIYGEEIRVEFIKHVRDERKFAGIDELKAQIEKDCIDARAYHRQRGGI